MVHIKGGTFMMGSHANEPSGNANERPQHQVTVSSFFMGKFQVMQMEYEIIMGSTQFHFKGSQKLPVKSVSWFEAIEDCNRRSQKEGLTLAYTINGMNEKRTVGWDRNAKGYRLPTEAEWEYACRAGSITPFYT
jgi:formylglycine-generating enzyme required for sulfatase activity